MSASADVSAAAVVALGLIDSIVAAIPFGALTTLAASVLTLLVTSKREERRAEREEGWRRDEVARVEREKTITRRGDAYFAFLSGLHRLRVSWEETEVDGGWRYESPPPDSWYPLDSELVQLRVHGTPEAAVAGAQCAADLYRWAHDEAQPADFTKNVHAFEAVLRRDLGFS